MDTFTVTVTERSRRVHSNAKFRITTTDISFSLTPFLPQANFSVLNIINGIKQALNQTIKSSLDHVGQDDKVRLVLNHKDLDRPISVPMVKRSQLTPDLLCERIMRVAQSKKELLFHGLLTLNVLSTTLPLGGGNGGRHKDGVIDFTRWTKNSQCVVRIESNGNDCLPRAIVISKAKVDGIGYNEWQYLRKNQLQRLDKAAVALTVKARVTLGSCGATFDDLSKYQEALPGYQLIVVTPEGGSDFYYRGTAADKQIFVIYHNNHYDSLTSIKAFLKVDYWCRYCLKGFTHSGEHRCNFTCSRCFGSEKCEEGDDITCRKCKRSFLSEKCFNRHREETRICGRYFFCVNCNSEYSNKSKHICQHYFCKTCNENVPFGHHKCFMQTLDPEVLKKQDQEPRVHIFYDIESMFVTRNDHQVNHKPNLVVVKTCCSYCWQRMDKYPLPEGCALCCQQQMNFYGTEAVKDFSEWLFGVYEYLLQANSKVLGIKQIIDCNVFAHNARSYDAILVMNYLLSSRRKPDVIKNGQKIITMRVGRFKFLDSIAFITMPLRNFADTFDLPSGKGMFPYFMNTPENQTYIGRWPEKALFGHVEMKGKMLVEFDEWYEVNRNKEFNLKNELIKYCDQDVMVLMKGVQAFQKLLIEITGLDPFTRNITLSSFVMTVFRACYLPGNTLAIPPVIGYEPKRQQSHIASVWLDYLESTENISINREVQLGQYYADGYHPESRRVYEFFGCYFHGCKKCFPTKRNVTMNNISGLSMSQLAEGTRKKIAFYKENKWDMTTIYECELKEQLNACPEMERFFKKTGKKFKKPINIRDCYYGGRVETIKFLREVQQGEVIKYFDINSLYPAMLKLKKFPKGHPQIIYNNFESLDKYEGIISLNILPPRGLFHPLLPAHINEKLMYVLCRTCAEDNADSTCCHNDEQRSLVGTWVLAEVKKAIELGYQVKEIFCIWHFNEFAYDDEGETIYKRFINTWMKIKLQASGWPKPDMTEYDKRQYVASIKQYEDIDLEKDKICKRKDLRTTGKLCGNSFYGKTAEKAIRTQTKFVSRPCDYFELLGDHAIEIVDVILITDETIQVSFIPRDEFVPAPPHAAVIQACYVTAYARLHLYQYLEKLQKRVFYMDTDSVMFSYRDGELLPSTSMRIGDMSDEIKDEYGENAYIKRFCSIGCKSYCMDIEDGSGQSKYVNKFKGITCGFATELVVNFNSIREIIYDHDKSYQVPQKRFKINREYIIDTEQYDKKLRFTFNKRRVLDDYETEPFGY